MDLWILNWARVVRGKDARWIIRTREWLITLSVSLINLTVVLCLNIAWLILTAKVIRYLSFAVRRGIASLTWNLIKLIVVFNVDCWRVLFIFSIFGKLCITLCLTCTSHSLSEVHWRLILTWRFSRNLRTLLTLTVFISSWILLLTNVNLWRRLIYVFLEGNFARILMNQSITTSLLSLQNIVHTLITLWSIHIQ